MSKAYCYCVNIVCYLFYSIISPMLVVIYDTNSMTHG